MTVIEDTKRDRGHTPYLEHSLPVNDNSEWTTCQECVETIGPSTSSPQT